MDLGLILGSILRVISALNCVIFQAIILLIVGCGFGSILINFEVDFGVFRSKSKVYHEICEIVKKKPMFYLRNSMISRVWDLFFEPKSVEQHT